MQAANRPTVSSGQELKILSGKIGELTSHSPYTPVVLSGTDLHFRLLDQ